jgi:hypothetical protein
MDLACLKTLGHSDYTNLATQIYTSNHSPPDFRKNQTEKIVRKQPNDKKFRLVLVILKINSL